MAGIIIDQFFSYSIMKNHSIFLLLCCIPLFSASQIEWHYGLSRPCTSYFDSSYIIKHHIKEVTITRRALILKSKINPALDSDIVVQKEIYDSSGNLIKLLYISNRVDSEGFQYRFHYQYDRHHNLKKIRSWNDFFVYNNIYHNGKIIRAIIKDSIGNRIGTPEVTDSMYIISYTYDKYQRLISRKCVKGPQRKNKNRLFTDIFGSGSGLSPIPYENETETYKYDKEGNITEHCLMYHNTVSFKQYYLLNEKGKRVCEIDSFPSDTTAFIINYFYDSKENIDSEKIFKLCQHSKDTFLIYDTVPFISAKNLYDIKDTIPYISYHSFYDDNGCKTKDAPKALKGCSYKINIEFIYANKFWQ
jgi:hypothetical protein